MARRSKKNQQRPAKSGAVLPAPTVDVSAQWEICGLTAILLLAATLRLVALDQVPPAIHADEAPNAWNAYTLLKTGQDQYGVSWPVFYTRAFGDYRTTSYAYAILPFQFLGGMNVWTTRLPAAVSGIVTVLLIYFVGKRFFGATIGLVAAAMLALNPWHLQITRWGHEASLSPFLILLSIAALLWANLPLDDDEQRRPKPFLAALAGALIGISCYGYSAVRVFLPCFLLGVLIVTWRGWLKSLTDAKGPQAVVAMAVMALLLFAPLLWCHLYDPAISERARILGRIWTESDSFAEKAAKVIVRYLAHFGPDFLFFTGDQDPALSSPKGFGLFHWYDLPLMAVGLVKLAENFKASRAARVLLLWLVLYPVGDILFPHVSLHSLRSLAGVGCLILISSSGAVTAGYWLRTMTHRSSKVSFMVGVSAIVLFSHVSFLQSYFGEEFSRHKSSLIVFGADILKAANWIQPQLPEAAALFITGQAAHPDIVTLVGLNYDPQQWFREARELVHGPLPDGSFKDAYIYLRYGKIYFLLTEASIAALNKLSKNDQPDRVIFIVRPGELSLERFGPPVHEIRGAEGVVKLEIFDLTL